MTAISRAGVTRTPIVAFRPGAPFRFHQAGTDAATAQEGRAGETCYTTLAQFTRNVLARHPQQFRLDGGGATLPCLPRAAWATFDFAGKRPLFLLPSQALGSNVCTLLFLAALRHRFKLRGMGVFCAGSAADIYAVGKRGRTPIEVFTLWIGARDLKRFDVVVDLGHLESRRDIDVWPVDMEGELLEAFGGLAPSPDFPSDPRPLPADRPARIALMPLSSSPMRTLPPSVTNRLAAALGARGEVTICLNDNQQQGRLYRQALDVPTGTRVIESYPSVGGLLRGLAGFDYAVLADSGPAHMTKLFAIPGLAIYTSAPPEVLQGRFRNLTPWTVPFIGPDCAAPCGLAKLRIAADGRVGCMGSLRLSLEQLPRVAQAADPAAVERLLLREPIPCVAHLGGMAAAVADIVDGDFSGRLASRP